MIKRPPKNIILSNYQLLNFDSFVEDLNNTFKNESTKLISKIQQRTSQLFSQPHLLTQLKQDLKEDPFSSNIIKLAHKQRHEFISAYIDSEATAQELAFKTKFLTQKIESQTQTIKTLRLTYLKDIQQLREQLMQVQRPEFSFLDVRYFGVDDGLDEQTLEILNEKIRELSMDFNRRLSEMSLENRVLKD